MSSRRRNNQSGSSSNNKENNNNNNNAAAATNSTAAESSIDTIMPHPEKVTDFMRHSLDQFHSSLICPLCHKMLKDPCTLSCAHTFCRECMESYSCNNTLCPVKGCGMPLSMTGSRKGSFYKINPSLETVLCSFQTICQTLDRAPKQWWIQGSAGHDDEEEEHTTTTTRGGGGNDNDSSSCSSDEEMITLDVTAATNATNTEANDSDDNSDDDEGEGMETQEPANPNNWLGNLNIDTSDEEE